MLVQEGGEHPVWRDEPHEAAVLVDNGNARFAVLDHFQRDRLLIAAGIHRGRVGVHDLGHRRLAGHRQQALDRHQPDQLAAVEDRDVVCGRELAADGGPEHALGRLLRRRDRHAMARVGDRDLQQLRGWAAAIQGEHLGRRLLFRLAVTHSGDSRPSLSEPSSREPGADANVPTRPTLVPPRARSQP